MRLQIKKLILSSLTNLFLFVVMIIGIQNSGQKASFNFVFIKTIQLPISFIIGSSFLTGTFIGSLIPIRDIQEN